MLVVSLIVAIYYNVITAYSIIYVGVSFRGITDPEVRDYLQDQKVSGCQNFGLGHSSVCVISL